MWPTGPSAALASRRSAFKALDQGKGGLFADEVGALAVPVNELLRDYMGRQQEKHWWLALLVNPTGRLRPLSHSTHRTMSEEPPGADGSQCELLGLLRAHGHALQAGKKNI